MIRIKKSNLCILSIIMVLLMIISGFIGMVGAQDYPSEKEKELGAVIGYIYNSDNEPLAKATVVLSCMPNDFEKEECYYKQAANEDGYFEFPELHEGGYYIKAYFDGYHEWYEELKVPEGETLEVIIYMKLIIKESEKPEEPEESEEEYGAITGFVYNALEEEPIPWVYVALSNKEYEKRIIETETNERGYFEVKVPGGEYVIYVEARGYWPYEEWFEVYYGKTIEIKILLKPYVEEEERPVLCGHIFNAETDKPIFGWVELSQGDEWIPEPKPIKEYDWELSKEEFYNKEDCIEAKKTRCESNEEKEEYCKEKEYYDKPEDFKLWRTFSNDDGFYEYFDLSPGHYDMRVFAHGHVMYYNEINIEEDSHLYIDVYLLKEMYKPFIPEPWPYPTTSSISGTVFNQRLEQVIGGAFVCAIPLKLLYERLDDLEFDFENIRLEDLKLDEINWRELGLEDLNLDDMEIHNEVEVYYEEIPHDENVVDSDSESHETRGENDKDEVPEREEELPRPPEPPEEPKPPEPPEPVPLPEKNDLIGYNLFSYYTRTDDNGFFSLEITEGYYVLFVKAEGFKVFVYKFYIDPYQKMVIRAPLTYLTLSEATERDPNSITLDQPERPGAESLDADGSSDPTDDADDDKSDDKSDTSNLGSIIGSSAGVSNSVLATILGVLILIALLLTAVVWRKHKSVNNGKKKKVNKN